MKKLSNIGSFLGAVIVIMILISQPVLGAAAKLEKSITPLENGNYMIKIKVTALVSGIYTLKLTDPQTSIVDVYAPRGWCMITDGEDLLARTSTAPINRGKTVEFLIHSTTEEIKYSWSVFGKLKQLGKPGVL